MRTEKSLSGETLAQAVGVNISAISSWENGLTKPKANIVKLTKFFEVSTDYLLGLED